MFYSNKLFNTMTLITLSLSSVMAVSSSNWLFIWMALEINMLSFIPFIVNSKYGGETEAAVKYFMAQALGSSVMLMSSMTMWCLMYIPPHMSIILISSMLLKLGVAPFHFWFPAVMSSISWMSCLILSTWQKLAPLMILSFMLCEEPKLYIMFIAMLGAVFGGMMGMNQTHMRSIMAYSSITHLGWMTSLLYVMKPIMTMSYYIMYCTIIFPVFMIMNKNMTLNINQLSKMSSISPITQMLIPITLLSLSGMPPFSGFIPKWLAISSISQSNMFLLIMIILGAMMNMYFYLNIIFNSVLTMNKSYTMNKLNVMKNKLLVIVSTMLMIMLPMVMIY